MKNAKCKKRAAWAFERFWSYEAGHIFIKRNHKRHRKQGAKSCDTLCRLCHRSTIPSIKIASKHIKQQLFQKPIAVFFILNSSFLILNSFKSPYPH
jgi:hypothetical protein